MSEITLLDGGMGQELVHRSGDQPTPWWATQVMVDHPGLVADIHRDYFAAGATIATANTYAIHPDRFVGSPLADRIDTLAKLALQEAAAAQRGTTGTRIAGSVGPLAATYRPELHPPYEQARPAYATAAARLADDVDFILCETVASVLHARAILDGALETGKPVWLSVTVDDRNGALLRSGEPVSDIIPVVKDRAAAVLANCSAPEVMLDALDPLSDAGLPYGAYANGFQQITSEFLEDGPTVDVLDSRRDLTPPAYADHALRWIDHGATIVGGCCEVGPAHITELAKRIRAAGHTIV
ncbi:MAG: homocysteine S-methyltransferase family protein [Marinosulfonomonas sp.]